MWTIPILHETIKQSQLQVTARRKTELNSLHANQVGNSETKSINKNNETFCLKKRFISVNAPIAPCIACTPHVHVITNFNLRRSREWPECRRGCKGTWSRWFRGWEPVPCSYVAWNQGPCRYICRSSLATRKPCSKNIECLLQIVTWKFKSIKWIQKLMHSFFLQHPWKKIKIQSY